MQKEIMIAGFGGPGCIVRRTGCGLCRYGRGEGSDLDSIVWT